MWQPQLRSSLPPVSFSLKLTSRPVGHGPTKELSVVKARARPHHAHLPLYLERLLLLPFRDISFFMKKNPIKLLCSIMDFISSLFAATRQRRQTGRAGRRGQISVPAPEIDGRL